MLSIEKSTVSAVTVSLQWPYCQDLGLTGICASGSYETNHKIPVVLQVVTEILLVIVSSQRCGIFLI